MIVELIAVGSELLNFGRPDTNSDWLAERVMRLGVRVGARTAVADEVERIASVVRAARERADVVVVCGGLGPTADDRSRPALARALGVELEADAAMVAALDRRYRQRGVSMRPEQARMAERPRGAGWLANPLGTAPGIAWEHSGARLYALPGVPDELKAMFVAEVEPRLQPEDGRRCRMARGWLLAARSESSVDAQIHDLYRRDDLELTVLARSGGVEIRVLFDAEDPLTARRALDRLDEELGRRFGEDLIGPTDQTLEQRVAGGLAAAGQTLAVAESCTAGMLAATLTAVPGASAWFRGGVIVYHDALKAKLAGVDPGLIARRGAVDAAVALELARGVLVRCDADIGVGISGIAGPGGGSPDKPVGLVHVAAAGSLGEDRRELRLGGGRALIRERAVTGALDLLRRMLRGAGQ